MGINRPSHADTLPLKTVLTLCVFKMNRFILRTQAYARIDSELYRDGWVIYFVFMFMTTGFHIYFYMYCRRFDELGPWLSGLTELLFFIQIVLFLLHVYLLLLFAYGTIDTSGPTVAQPMEVMILALTQL